MAATPTPIAPSLRSLQTSKLKNSAPAELTQRQAVQLHRADQLAVATLAAELAAVAAPVVIPAAAPIANVIGTALSTQAAKTQPAVGAGKTRKAVSPPAPATANQPAVAV